jgi:Antitoxin Xre/MbcA/ParS C-terminal toxin-binding domain/Antitoxin Xre-like helix-turn-helix domain
MMKSKAQKNSRGAQVTKAVLRGASKLRLPDRTIGHVIGVSDANVMRMHRGQYVLTKKAFELTVLLIRLFESLDRIVGGDEESARSWLRSCNAVLGGKPIERIQTISGLTDTIAYLDTRSVRS